MNTGRLQTDWMDSGFPCHHTQRPAVVVSRELRPECYVFIFKIYFFKYRRCTGTDNFAMVTECNRMWASAAFVGVLIVVGVPLWWKTTEVYRVSLPYDEIASLTSLPQYLTSDVVILADDQLTADQVAEAIGKSFDGSDVLKLNIKKSVLSEELHHTLAAAADDEEALEAVAATFDQKPNLIYVVQRRHLSEHVWLGVERIVMFRDVKDAETLTSVLYHWVYNLPLLLGARSARSADASRRLRLPPAPHYDLLLTVAHPKPERLDVEWDAEGAANDYIGTFVDELRELHNFTLKTQWLHMLEYNFQGKEVTRKSAGGDEWPSHKVVRESRLHGLVTKVDTRAATQVSSRPTVNLLLYVQPCDTPIVLADDNDEPINTPVQAFLFPKWGGVYLASPPLAVCKQEKPKWRPPTRVVMGAFVAQLRTLLGIADVKAIEGAYLEPLRDAMSRYWERDSATRARTLEHGTAAALTLTSLAQLLGEISNIVINAETGASINKAVKDIQAASELMARGDIVAAYQVSQSAMLEAEAAFTDPSLLALLYFPDDQKYAVYIPLFLPIMVPVVLSLMNLVLWFRGKSKEKTD